MMARILAAFLIGGALFGATSDASAEEALPKLRELLGQGYAIKELTVIPQEVVQRMAGDATWKDDLMVTLQRGSQVAFCHVVLSVTLTQGTGFLDTTCQVQR
jgi:hypothetical protein